MNKYFSYRHNRSIDLTSDGCNIEDWEHSFGKFLFAKHDKGFFIFISPDEIRACNEYAKSDPYSVEENIDSDFHKKRIECTLELTKEATDNLQGKTRLLDLGCGQGHITNAIRQSFPDAEISGLDYSVAAIEYAVDHFPGIDFAVGNACDCPYTSEYFDIIICNNLWEHVPDPINLLSKISHMLKKDGWVIISTPSRYRVSNLLRVLRGRPASLISKHHVTEYSVGQVIEQLKYGNFTVSKVLSKPVKVWSVKSKIAKILFSMFIRLSGSSHQLEPTVFYLARRTSGLGSQDGRQ